MGRAVQRWTAGSRVPGAKAVLLYGGALVATVYVKVLIDQVDEVSGPNLSVPLEALTLLLVACLLVRFGAARR